MRIPNFIFDALGAKEAKNRQYQRRRRQRHGLQDAERAFYKRAKGYDAWCKANRVRRPRDIGRGGHRSAADHLVWSARRHAKIVRQRNIFDDGLRVERGEAPLHFPDAAAVVAARAALDKQEARRAYWRARYARHKADAQHTAGVRARMTEQEVALAQKLETARAELWREDAEVAARYAMVPAGEVAASKSFGSDGATGRGFSQRGPIGSPDGGKVSIFAGSSSERRSHPSPARPPEKPAYWKTFAGGRQVYVVDDPDAPHGYREVDPPGRQAREEAAPYHPFYWVEPKWQGFR